ncbi:Hypothetical protein CINCED_3A016087 [Cinara cedri]|uniref:Uncharacterized protein n=1 Tax=Cinara cedri TaxID=506608 RepID=A0A5E4NDZ0_9HEMI|nr:Hypothetical protein CINCED_3A016087 [Cinara cedri]
MNINLFPDYLSKRKKAIYQKNVDRSDIEKCSKNILETYSDALDSDNFESKLIQFQEFRKLFLDTKQDPGYYLKYIRSMNIRHTIPNVNTILQIYLSMPRLNCSSER